MGIDVRVFVKREDLKKLISNFDDLYFLWDFGMRRWWWFSENFGVENKVGSKELIEKLAKLNRKISLREDIVRVCNEYDLIFQPDIEEKPKGFIDVYDLVSWLIKIGIENVDYYDFEEEGDEK